MGDGSHTTTSTFNVTVTPINDSPTISAIADQTINENTATNEIDFNVSNVMNPSANPSVSVSSSNQALVSGNGSDSLAIHGSGGRPFTRHHSDNGSIRGNDDYRFGKRRHLIADHRILCRDCQPADRSELRASTITPINDTSTPENVAIAIPYFTIGDAVTPVNSILVTATSSNPTLVPNDNVGLSKSGDYCYLTVTPAADQLGTTTITVAVNDGTNTTTESFNLTVNGPVLDGALAMSNISQQTATSGVATAIPFFIGGTDDLSSAILTASSGNSLLVSDDNIVFSGSGTNRTVTVTPAAGQTGSMTIDITATDGPDSVTKEFSLTVNAANAFPTISSLADQAMNESTVTPAIHLYGQEETLLPQLDRSNVTASSSNNTLLPQR